MTRTRVALLLASVAGGALLASAAVAEPVITVAPPPGVTVTTTGPDTVVNQGTNDRVVVNWDSFNVGSTESVTFVQPSTTSIAFNRINPSSFTTIDGAINGNGQVWLFSPGGLLIGGGARINVGSFVASTGTFGDGDALDGDDDVTVSGATAGLTVAPGAIINAGGGYVVLHAPILNQGGVITPVTSADYIASGGVTVNAGVGDGGDVAAGGVSNVVASTGQAVLTHTGQTTTTGLIGRINMEAAGTPPSGGGFGSVINFGGTVQALGVVNGPRGTVTLSAVGGLIDSTAAPVESMAGDTTMQAADVRLGDFALDGDLTITADDAATLNGLTTMTGSLDVTTLNDGVSGDIVVGGNILAGDSIVLRAARDIRAPGVYLQADRDGQGTGDLRIELDAVGSVRAAGATLLGGPTTTNRTSRIVVSAGSFGERGVGGDVELGSLYGTSVAIDATSDDPGTGLQGGAITVGAIAATGNVDIDSYARGSFGPFTQNGNLSLIRLAGAVTAGGYVHVTNRDGGDIAFEADVTANSSIFARTSGSILLTDGITLRSDADGDFGGSDGTYIELTAGTDVLGANASLFAGSLTNPGPDNLGSGNIYVSAGVNPFELGLVAGGDIRLGQLRGIGITLDARANGGDPDNARGGNIDLYGQIFASGTFRASVSGFDYYAPCQTPGCEGFDLVSGFTGGHIRFADTAPVETLGGIVVSNNNGGDIDVNAGLTANGSVVLRADRDITVAAVTLQADRNRTNDGEELTLEAGRDMLAANASLMGGAFLNQEGPYPGLYLYLTAPVTVTAGSFNRGGLGGNAEIGTVYGSAVSISATSAGVYDDGTGDYLYRGGAVTTYGQILSASDVSIANYWNNGPSGSLIHILGPVAASNRLRIDNSDGGDIQIDYYASAGSGVVIIADRDVILSPGSIVIADNGGNGPGDNNDVNLQVLATRDVLADGSTLVGGNDAANPTVDVYVTAGIVRGRGAPPPGLPDPGVGGTGGSITAGAISGRNVYVTANAGFDGGGSVDLNGDIFARDLLSVAALEFTDFEGTFNAGDIRVASGVTLHADADGDGVGGVSINASGSFDAAADSLILAGLDESTLTAPVDIVAGTSSYEDFGGGDLTVGRIMASDITLQAVFHDFGGGVTVGGVLTATGDIDISNTYGEYTAPPPPSCDGECAPGSGAQAAPPPPPAISILMDMTSGGNINVTSVDDIYVEMGVTVRANNDGDGVGGLFLHAARNINALSGSMLGAGAIGLPGAGAVEIIAGFPVPRTNAVGGDVTTDAVFGGDVLIDANAGAGALGSVTVNGLVDAGNLDVTADDFVALGSATSRGYIHGTAGSDFTLAGAVAAADDIALDARAGQIAMLAGSSLRSDSDGVGGGALTLRASSNIAMNVSSSIATGSASGAATADANLTAGYAFGAGGPDAGDLFVDSARVNNLVLTANRAGLLGGRLQVTGDATAAGDISGSTFRSVTLGAGSVLRADADGAGGGDLMLNADGAIIGAADSLVASGADGLPGTGTVQIRSGLGGPGGNLQLGDVIAGTATLIAGAGSDATVLGAIDASGDGLVSAGGTVTVSAITAGGGFTLQGGGAVLMSGPVNVGTAFGATSTGAGVTVNGPVSAGTSAAFNAQGLGATLALNGDVTAGTTVIAQSSRGAINVASGVTLRGDNDGAGATAAILAASGDITLGAGALLVSGPAGTPTGDITVFAGSNFAAGGPDAGALTFTGASISGRTVNLSARRVGAVGGIVNAGAASATQQLTITGYDINLSATSVLRGDSDGVGAGGVTVTAAHNVAGAAGSLVALGLAGGPGRGLINVAGGQAGGGTVVLDQLSGGALTLSSLAGAGGNGDLTVTSALAAPGAITLTAGGSILTGTITGGADVDLTATGAAGFGNASATGRFAVAAGGAITPMGTVTAGGLLRLRSTGGALTTTGALVAGTDMDLAGSSVTLGGAATANGAIGVQSLSGDVVLSSPLRADADGIGGGDLTITSARNVTANALLRTGLTTGPGTGAILVTAGTVSGGNATVGTAIAGRIDVLAYQSGVNGGGVTINGPLSAVTGIVLHNDVLTGGPGGASLDALGAPPPPPAISILADMTSGGDITVTSIDAIYVETGVTVRANDDGDAVGALTFHAARNIDALAGSRLGAGALGLTPRGSVEIIAGFPVPRANGVGGNLLTDTVFGGDVRLEARAGAGAAGNVTANGPIDATNLDVVAAGFARLGPTTSRGYVRGVAGTDFTVTGAVAAAVEVSIDAQRGVLSLDPGVSVRSDSDGNGVGDLTLRASGALTMGAGSTLVTGLTGGAPSTNIALTAGQAFGLGGPDAGSLTFTSVIGRNVSLTARRAGGTGGVISGGNASATELLTVTGYDIVLNASTTLRGDSDGAGPGGLTLTATHDVVGAAGSLLASGLNGAPGRGLITVVAGSGGAGGSATLGAVNGGSLDLRALNGAGGLGDLTVLGATTATGAVNANAARNLTLTGALSAGTSATLVAGGAANVGVATTGGAFDLTAGGDALLSGPVTTGGAMSVVANGGLTANGQLTSSSYILLAGRGANGVRLNAGASAADYLQVEAQTGAITLASGATYRADADGNNAGQLLLFAGRNVNASGSSLATGSAGGPATTFAQVSAGFNFGGGSLGGDVRLSDLRAGNFTITADRAAGVGGLAQIAGTAQALGDASIYAYDVSLLAGATVRGDADGVGAGGLTILASHDITATGDSLLASGLSGGPGRGLVTVVAGSGGTGGSATLGAVNGGSLDLRALSGAGGVGDLTVLGSATSTGAASLNAARDLRTVAALTAGSATLVAGRAATVGPATTTGAFDLTAGGDALLGGPITTGGTLTARSTGGGLTSNGALSSGSTLSLTAGGASGLRVNGGASANGDATLRATAGAVTLGAGALVRADADGNGAGVLTVQASGDVLADPASLLVTGLASGLPTTAITVTGGGDLTLGNVRGRDVTLSGRAVTLGGDTSALRTVSITGTSLTLGSGGVLRADADGDAVGDLNVAVSGDVTAAATSLIAIGSDANPTGVLSFSTSGGNLTLGRLSAGFVRLTATGATGRITLLGDTVGRTGIDIQAVSSVRVAGLSSTAGAIAVRSGADVLVSSGAQVNGFAGLTVEAGTTLTVDTGAQLQGGYGAATPGTAAWPTAPSPSLGGVRLIAADIDLRGSVRAYAGTGLGDVFIGIRNAGTNAVIGGETGSGGFHLSNGEIGRISGRNLVVTAGTFDSPSGALTVRDITLTSGQISALWLGSNQIVRVTGSVSSTGSSPADVRIGFLLPSSPVTQPGGAQAIGALGAPVPAGFADFVPSSIIVTGSLGGDGRLGRVGLVARGDILMGSDAFITETGSPTFNPRSPTSAPPSAGHLFVQADGLQLATGGRILQQNTGNAAVFGGLRIGAPTATRPLITWFDFLGTTAPPSVIDLYGAIAQADGSVLSDTRAADTPFLLTSQISVIDDYKFNTCTFGRAASCLFRPTFQDPFEIIDPDFPISEQVAIRDLLSFMFEPPDDEDKDELYIGVPITGSGNEDLWFGTNREPGR